METLKTIIIIAIYIIVVFMTSPIGENVALTYRLWKTKRSFLKNYKKYKEELRDSYIINAEEPKELKIYGLKEDFRFHDNVSLRRAFMKGCYAFRRVLEQNDFCYDPQIEAIFAEIRRIAFSNGEATSEVYFN